MFIWTPAKFRPIILLYYFIIIPSILFYYFIIIPIILFYFFIIIPIILFLLDYLGGFHSNNKSLRKKGERGSYGGDWG